MDNLNKTISAKMAKIFLAAIPVKPSPLMRAAINGDSDMYIVRESMKYLEGKETITMQDIRNARNAVMGVGSGD